MKIAFKKVYEPVGWLLVTLGIVLLAYICYKFFNLTKLALTGNQIDSELTSAIGSIISGTVGILFSLSAVIFFIVALYAQKEELQLQREELKQTRSIFKLQAFETTFFNLLQTQQSIRLEIMKRDGAKTPAKHWSTLDRGNENFSFLSSQLQYDIDSLSFDSIQSRYHEKQAGDSTFKTTLESWVLWTYYMDLSALKENYKGTIYKRFLEVYRDVLPHYFNNLYFILKFIFDTSLTMDITNDNFKRDLYVNFVKAQISLPEMYLIAEHSNVYPSFQSLLINLNWFDNIDEEDYIMT